MSRFRLNWKVMWWNAEQILVKINTKEKLNKKFEQKKEFFI